MSTRTMAVVVMTGLLMGMATTSAATMDEQIALNCKWAEKAFSKSGPGGPFAFKYRGQDSNKFLPGWTHELKVEQADKTREVRTLTLTDPATSLEVKVVANVYLDTPGVDWTLHFTNRGQADAAVLEDVKAVSMTTDTRKRSGQAKVVVHRLKGGACQVDDWLPFDHEMPPSPTIELATTNGRASNACPFFNLDWGTGGAITAIGWSGQWAGQVAIDEDGIVQFHLGPQWMHLKLHPGESVRGPRILQVHWSGIDACESYNLFRRTMMAHILPRIDSELVVPPFAHMSTSFYELNDSNEANVLSHLESTRGLGFDTFWLDAYWHGQGGFPTGQGNYGFPIERVEPKDRFPHGLKAISEAVEKEGLKFLLWFEPERVAPGTLIAKEHPEWVISVPGVGDGLFNLGNPDARKYMTDYLNAAIKAYKVTCLRIDYNIDPLGYWQHMDSQDPQRLGITEIRYIEGLYQMWDDIRKANPKLYIDDCASGGRRIDVETLSRSIPLWRSDNTCDMVDHKPETIALAAIKNQVMSAGLNRYVPFSTAGQMGTTPYLFRSGFNGGIAFAEDARPKDYPRDQLKAAIAEGKRIRKYYYGDFYVLSPVTISPKDWCAMQYHRPAEQDGMIVAFRRPESPALGFALDRLRGIEDTADYVVTKSYTYTPSEPATMKGSALKAMELKIDEQPGSVILEYARKPEGKGEK